MISMFCFSLFRLKQLTLCYFLGIFVLSGFYSLHDTFIVLGSFVPLWGKFTAFFNTLCNFRAYVIKQQTPGCHFRGVYCIISFSCNGV